MHLGTFISLSSLAWGKFLPMCTCTRSCLKGPGKRVCRHFVADRNVSPFARARSICCGHRFCVRDTKNVSDFVQKHFVSATNVSQFAQPKKHHGQQCVRNNVSSFTRALMTQKSCAVGMRNAILRNRLNYRRKVWSFKESILDINLNVILKECDKRLDYIGPLSVHRSRNCYHLFTWQIPQS